MKNYDIGVIGLGYVGLTLAAALAETGLNVIGAEKRADAVEKINRGESHFFETGLDETLARVVRGGFLTARTEFEKDALCEICIITVGTPLDAEGGPRRDMVEAAARQAAAAMTDGALVILRSTVETGTARNVVAPVLKASGKQFDIAMCPERTLEGAAMKELREIPQIIGADSERVRARAEGLFRRLTKAIVQVSSLEAAEIIKLTDNAYRDVQFGFANEVARLCEAWGVDGHDVIKGGALGYERTNVASPGLVGGPCLEKDPHIMAHSARAKGLELEIVQAARLVNERQPRETAEFIAAEMARRSMAADAPVTFMGMAFKGVPATDDLRGAMSLKVLDAVRALRPGAPLTLFDPVIEPARLRDLFGGCRAAENRTEAVHGAAVVVITNNHPDLGRTAPAAALKDMAPGGFIYDYWNHFSHLAPGETQNSYFAVGRTHGRSGESA